MQKFDDFALKKTFGYRTKKYDCAASCGFLTAKGQRKMQAFATLSQLGSHVVILRKIC